jgi:hypothetical protein
MPDPSISDDDVTRMTLLYLDRMRRQPPPRDIQDEVMRSILAPRQRRAIPIARLVASGLVVVAIAVVASVALVAHLSSPPTPGVWSIVSTSSSPSGSSGLSAITCVSVSDCWAAGYSFDQNGNARPLIEQNTGSGWRVVSSPSPSGSTDSELQGLACVSADDCWAVGYSIEASGGSRQTLIEHYGGSGWGIVSSPNPSGSTDTLLYGVACVGADDCWAVGLSAQGALMEHDGGGGWSIVSSPAAGSQLRAVTCVNASDCWAVGGSASNTFAEHYDGRGWSAVLSPVLSATGGGVLLSVSCASAGDCWAVGVSVVATDKAQTLLEHYLGRGWGIVASPNRTDGSDSQLESVTCVSIGDCWAVGWFMDAANALQTLIEQETGGGGWSIVSSPDHPGGAYTQLQAVTCVGAGDCWAVGGPGDLAGQVVMQLTDQSPS